MSISSKIIGFILYGPNPSKEEIAHNHISEEEYKDEKLLMTTREKCALKFSLIELLTGLVQFGIFYKFILTVGEFVFFTHPGTCIAIYLMCAMILRYIAAKMSYEYLYDFRLHLETLGATKYPWFAFHGALITIARIIFVLAVRKLGIRPYTWRREPYIFVEGGFLCSK